MRVYLVCRFVVCRLSSERSEPLDLRPLVASRLRLRRWSARAVATGRKRDQCRLGGPAGKSLAGLPSWRSVVVMESSGQQPPITPASSNPTGAFISLDVEAVARRVVELIHEEIRPLAPRRLVDAATLAAELGVKRSWVYEHRDELAPVRLGGGSKARLRFDLNSVAAIIAARNDGQQPLGGVAPGVESQQRRRSQRTGVNRGTGRILLVRPRGAR